MPDFEKMCFQLAVKVADAIELLTKAQLEGEETYVNDAENQPAVSNACEPT